MSTAHLLCSHYKSEVNYKLRQDSSGKSFNYVTMKFFILFALSLAFEQSFASDSTVGIVRGFAFYSFKHTLVSRDLKSRFTIPYSVSFVFLTNINGLGPYCDLLKDPSRLPTTN